MPAVAEDSRQTPEWIDLLLAVTLALAAVGTAWAGFQSAKWSGVQANSYAKSGATRSESNQSTARAAQQRIVDAVGFSSWIEALQREIIADPSIKLEGGWEPRKGSFSAFFFERFRDEFRPAVDAWIESRPLLDPDAPPTPFDMPEYQLASEKRALQLEAQAEALASTARDANQRSDNYVLTAVVFALVLFFAGVAGRAKRLRSQALLSVLAGTALVASIVLLLVQPIEI
jgi:hypothetical protein